MLAQMSGSEEECSQYVAALDMFKPNTKIGGLSSN